jgi:SpoVK/Ycf46/Vps4 family AAA+-type ATPase
MNKYDELKKEYRDLANFVSACFLTNRPAEEVFADVEIFAVSCSMRLWGAVGLYSQDYRDALFAITGKRYSMEQILTAISRAGDTDRYVRTPDFFKKLVEKDLRDGTNTSRDFLEMLNRFLVSVAFINGDFPMEEANAATEIIERLQSYSAGQGLASAPLSFLPSARITPLYEESYVRKADKPKPDAPAPKDAPPPGKTGAGNAPGSAGSSGTANTNILDILNRLRLDFTLELPKSGADPDFTPTPAKDNERRTTQSETTPAEQEPVKPAEDERTLEQLLEELDSLVGLDTVKRDVHSLLNFIKVTKLRTERGMKVPVVSYHLVFTGNPGTGKTTVARLVAQIYYKMGILPKGQLVETDRSALVAGYVGQTAIKTQAVIKEAMGGVLFIDEAYSLAGGSDDSFGKESVETILKAMEDHRDSLVVVVAGYDELMHKFINSNPGLASRFNKYFHFPDYTGEEMLRIFARFCGSNGYNMDDDDTVALLERFSALYEVREEHFGNARLVRNVFEKAIQGQADRLADYADVSDHDLAALTRSDLDAAMGITDEDNVGG